MHIVLRKRRNDYGGVFVEAAFTLPLLLFLSFSIAQIGTALSQYLTLSRIAYEGARFAAAMPGLVAGLNISSSCDQKLKDCNVPYAVKKIHDRVSELLVANHLPPDDVIVSTYELEEPDLLGGPTRRVLQVSVTVGAPFNRRIFPASILPNRILSRISSPHLFPDGVK